MREIDTNIYESSALSFQEKVLSIDLDVINKYTRENVVPPVRDYAFEALNIIANKGEWASKQSVDLARALKNFKPHYINCMSALRDESYYSCVINWCKRVIEKCFSVLGELKDTEKEIKEYIKLLKKEKETLLDTAELNDSIEVAKQNGCDMQIKDIEELFKNNGYINSMIAQIKEAKNKNHLKIEMIDYELGSFMLLKLYVIKKKTKVIFMKNKYLEYMRGCQTKFDEAYKCFVEAKNELYNYLNCLSRSQKRYIITTFGIAHEPNCYGAKAIVSWVLSQRQEMDRFYLNESD